MYLCIVDADETSSNPMIDFVFMHSFVNSLYEGMDLVERVGLELVER
jgi:hypothetical protein